ncbi:alpha/beta fold hydrolase [Paenarthrobacter nitroguajacolicus]|uniref:Alpha/beta fold hydrolase n=2 Tax=Paenarthrobacter nitroguajacolicus TaxID=211146 RepID=A0A558GR78_PAENT|nr:alpha/beta fold hydrolase [Paenarthrobacter nitroguajacolicus]
MSSHRMLPPPMAPARWCPGRTPPPERRQGALLPVVLHRSSSLKACRTSWLRVTWWLPPITPGMGIAGPSSFLIGATEAANVLDIARAARGIEGIGAGNRVVLWGHSQGGHASIFAAQRAASYASELAIAGVAVAAPATNLGALLSADIGDVSGVTIGAYAFTSYAQAYSSRLPNDPLTTILTPAGAAAAPKMAELCLLGQNSELHTIANPLIGSFVTGDPTQAPGWSQLLAENTPAQAPLTAPLFVAQGAKDTLVRPEITAAYVAAQTQGGTAVESHVLPDATHGTVALDAMPYLMKWMAALP